jgi:hypothetical protein
MLSHRDALRITCRILLHKDGALHPFTARSFGALYSITTVPCFNTSALCIFGGPIFGGCTLCGDQWDPGHVNPVALLPDRRLRQPPNGLARPMVRRNICL